MPAVTTAVRGMAALDFSVSTARWNVHSGTYGGAVPNAVSVLARLLAGLHDERGRVAVDGFYDRVAEAAATRSARAGRRSPLTREALPRGGRQPLPHGRAAVHAARADLGAADARDQRRLGRLSGRGHPHDRAGQGARQADLPARRRAGSAGGHRPDRGHLRRHTPAGAELVIESSLAGAPPLAMRADSPAIRAAAAALEDVWQRPAVIGRPATRCRRPRSWRPARAATPFSWASRSRASAPTAPTSTSTSRTSARASRRRSASGAPTPR